MLYLKLAPHSCFDESSRDKRELSLAQQMGYDVLVVSGEREMPDEAQEHGYSHVYSGTAIRRGPIYATMFEMLRELRIIKRAVRGNEPSIISCHNLYALILGYMCMQGMSKKPKLIYDAHEFELGLARYNGNRIYRAIGKALEGYLLRRCDLAIVINEGIHEAMLREHGFSFPCVVVRSTPFLFPEDRAATRETREAFLRMLEEQGCPREDDEFIAMYQGYIQKNRGIENLIQATALLPWLRVVILGNANPNEQAFYTHIQTMVSELGVENRVLFHPAVPSKELWRYTAAADVGIVGHQPKVQNYIYALPNKFFENVQAMVPVVCTDVPELRRLVDRYGIGLLVQPGPGGKEWAEAILKMRNDREAYERYKEGLQHAKAELCWERESQVLEEALKSLNICNTMV